MITWCWILECTGCLGNKSAKSKCVIFSKYFSIFLVTSKQFKHLQWENSHVTAEYGHLSEANSCWTNTTLSSYYYSLFKRNFFVCTTVQSVRVFKKLLLFSQDALNWSSYSKDLYIVSKKYIIKTFLRHLTTF